MEIIFKEKIDSTNIYGKKNIETLADKSVVCAAFQTQGRGRMNRKWMSFESENLYASIILKPQEDYSKLPISNLTQLLSVVIVDVLRFYGINANIKWPNDVIISEEPIIEDAEDLMKERTKTIDELLKDASDEIIDVEDTITDNLDLTEEYRKIEDEIDSALDLTSHIEPVVEDEEEIKEDKKESKKEKKSSLENDTLENDLYDLIDSMYDNTEDGE